MTPKPILNEERKYLEKNFMVNVNNGQKSILPELKNRPENQSSSPEPIATNHVAENGSHVTILAVTQSDPSTHQTIITLPSLTSSSQLGNQTQQIITPGGHVTGVTQHVTNGVLVTTTTTPCSQTTYDQQIDLSEPRIIHHTENSVELTYLKNFSQSTNQNHVMFHYADFTEIGNGYQEGSKVLTFQDVVDRLS